MTNHTTTKAGRIMTTITAISFLLLISTAATMPQQQQQPQPSQQQQPPQGAIKGRVLENATQQPMEYVNIVIYTPDGERLITGGITDANGEFTVGSLAMGRYRVTISFMGYKTITIDTIAITPSRPVTDAGTHLLTPDERFMGDVVVRAERDQLTVNLDKRIYAVDSDLTATGGSLLELMEALPSVTVDYEGRVSLRGSTNVTILVDGRPSQFISLDQLPGTMIDRIEVITNPSARYDPDGTSGIINVIMKRQRQHGTGVMVSTTLATGNRYSTSVNVNHRRDRINIFGNYDMNINSNVGENTTTRNRITADNDTLKQLYQQEEFFRRGYFHNVRGGADLFINSKNTITMMATLNYRDTRPRNYSQVDLFLPSEGTINTSMEREFEGLGMEYVLNYSRNFDREDRELVADLFYAVTSGDTYRDITVNHSDPLKPEEVSYLESLAPGKVLAFQTDYSQLIGNKGRLETGVKTLLRYIEDDFRFFDVDPETNSRSVNSGFTNHFIYNEAIHSLYGIGSLAAGQFHLQGGLRLEYHSSEAEQLVTDERSDRTFTSLFPSAHIRYLINSSNALQISYSRRINRPGIMILNPFVNYSDPMNISFGNPELKPEYINSWEGGYHFSEGRKDVSGFLFYRKTHDMMTREMTLMGGDNPQTETTFQNLQSGSSYGAEVSVTYPLTSWWRVNGNASYFYTLLEDDRLTDWEHQGDSWMFDVTSNWNIMKRFNLQSRFQYHSPQVTAGTIVGSGCQQHGGQGILDAVYHLDMALRTEVLNGNGTITLRVSDVFNSRGMSMFTYGESFTSTLSRKSQSRRLIFGFTFRFNDYRERRDRERERSLLDDIG